MIRMLKTLQNIIEYVFYRLVAECVKRMSLHTVQRFGMRLGSFVYTVVPIRRRVVMGNLRLAFPGKTDGERAAIARGAYQNLTCSLLEGLWCVRLTQADIATSISLANPDVLERVLAEDKGVIVIGGHFGSWELLALSMPYFARRMFTIVAQRQRNPYVDEYVTAIRTHLGTRIVTMKQAPREVLTVLRNRGAILLLADQSGPQDGLFVKFFGHYTSTHKGPAIFSLRTGAPMMMAYIHRSADGSFSIEFEALDTSSVTGSDEEKLRAYTELHVNALERHIRLHPDHWLWMHKRWKHPYHEAEAAQ